MRTFGFLNFIFWTTWHILMKLGVVIPLELIPASYSLHLIFEFVQTDQSGWSGNTCDLYLWGNRFEYRPVHRLCCRRRFFGFLQPPADKRWYGTTVYITTTNKTFVILYCQTIQCCVIRATESIVKWNHLVYAEDRWCFKLLLFKSPPGV